MTLAPEKAPAPRTARPAGAFAGSWPAVAAWGTGLVQAALGAAAIVSPAPGVATRAIGVVLVALGLAALAWGIATLRAERVLLPRTVVAVGLAGVVLDAVLLVLSPARTSVVGVGVATALAVVAAVAAASAARRPATPRPPGVWGILVAAAIIAVVVTPALGAVQDAVLLRDDGTLPVITHDGH